VKERNMGRDWQTDRLTEGEERLKQNGEGFNGFVFVREE